MNTAPAPAPRTHVRGGSRILAELKALTDTSDLEAEVLQLRAALSIARVQAGYDNNDPVRVWFYSVGDDDDDAAPYLLEVDALKDAVAWWKSENPQHTAPTLQWKPCGHAQELYALGRPTGITVYSQPLRRAAA